MNLLNQTFKIVLSKTKETTEANNIAESFQIIIMLIDNSF